MRFLSGALVVAGLQLSSGVASAQAAPAAQAAGIEDIIQRYNLGEVARQILAENLKRVRRGLVLGPHLGASALYLADDGKLDGAISGGLGFYVFSIPTTFEAPLSAVDKLKREVAERVQRLISAGKTPDAGEIAELARQVYRESRDEFLGKTPAAPSVFERPRAGVSLELARVLGAGDTQLRLTPSVAISYVNLGLVLGFTAGRHDGALLGGELSLRLLPGEGVRSNMVEFFARSEAMFTRSAGEFTSSAVHSLGGRFTLDLL